MTTCACPDVQYGVHLASCGDAESPSLPVGDTEASILAAGTDGRWLLIGDHGEGVGIPERDWPALVAALRQLGVIPKATP